MAASLEQYAVSMARAARAAGRKMALVRGAQRNAALRAIANALRDQADMIVAENARDIAAAAENKLTPAMVDRLKLDVGRVGKMARAVEEVAEQADPVGQVIEGQVRPNGLRIEKRRVPIGSVAIIFEARPNVTTDAAALCIKSGNASILRGGKECFYSNMALASVIAEGLNSAGLPAEAVQVVNTTDRDLVPILLKQADDIDLVIPRGGESLIRAVVEASHIPVIKHYTGNCHVYVDAGCPAELAEAVAVNAKVQRPGVCNAAESLLFHRDAAGALLPRVCQKLAQAGVEIRGDEETRRLFPAAKAATEVDWGTEYLDLIISVKVVASIEEAIDHINHYGSHHTEAILTHDVRNAEHFVDAVDSGNIMVNTTTRFSDGGEYGLGAEIGISTDKLHARGPMGAADLTTYKWVVTGYGQLRT